MAVSSMPVLLRTGLSNLAGMKKAPSPRKRLIQPSGRRGDLAGWPVQMGGLGTVFPLLSEGVRRIRQWCLAPLPGVHLWIEVRRCRKCGTRLGVRRLGQVAMRANWYLVPFPTPNSQLGEKTRGGSRGSRGVSKVRRRRPDRRGSESSLHKRHSFSGASLNGQFGSLHSLSTREATIWVRL